MKLVIGGAEYDVEEAMQDATLNDLYAMTAQTGIGMATLGKSLQGVDAKDPDAFLDNPKVFGALRCLVFLCKRHAGVKCTVEEANNFPFSDLSFEGAEEIVESDPTQLPGQTVSVPAEKVVVGATSSKTSSSRSARALV